MAYQVVNPSRENQKMVIQFLEVEGCQPAEIHRWTFAVSGAAHV
jgi:hypothetical protein